MSVARTSPLTDNARRAVAGNAAFTVDLYHRLSRSSTNVLFAPSSISAALVMAFAGAAGRTAEQMADVLHLDGAADRAVGAWAELGASLARRSQAPGVALDVANGAWAQVGLAFRERFLAMVGQMVASEMHEADFATAAAAARAVINRWVAERTHDKIPELIPAGRVNHLTVLVLVNAVYLHAEWEEAFDPSLSADAPFFISPDHTVAVRMMEKTGWLPYCRGHGFQVVELPYRGGELSLVVFVPESGSLVDIEDDLDAGRLEELLGALVRSEIRLALPRLSFTAKWELKGVLEALGMVDAFSGAADFSGMTTGAVSITAVIHEATLDVDEEGTTATAATAVLMGRGGRRVPPVPVRVDRPFLFLLRDRPTGTILFFGRVVDPTSDGAGVASP